ncbi:MAG: polyribonucleotide nucleotidyltransferase [Planctomycetes bacterium]|nr:polyribonucleotide nucleotidyltransferase [Planctomycetota bacterium]
MRDKVEAKIGSKTFFIETGHLAKLANGSAVVSYGDSVVLVSVVMGDAPPKRDGGSDDDFLPLTVDYREKTSAAGKIPGGFFKREGRPTTKEILTMRLIDRPLRPLFPAGFTNEIQIHSLVLSAEKDSDPDILALNGASAALCVSDIPFNGPIGAVRVGRLNNQFIVNPAQTEIAQGELDLVVAGSKDAVIMVEGAAREIAEHILVEAIEFAHTHIKQIVALQEHLMSHIKKTPAKPAGKPAPHPIYDQIKKQAYADLKAKIQTKSKQERRLVLNELKEKVVAKNTETISDETEKSTTAKAIKGVLGQLEKEAMRELIFENKRIDGRTLTDIRPISGEVGLLPRTHGSSLFNRGETQALVVLTLGSADDEQIIDGLLDEYSKKFILHYNFPSFSVGEVKPIRGPGRREIGHGNLAERALQTILPAHEEFPYTIRIVSDILQSNGSSSMATVCGGTLCLMDGGVPVKKPVAGIAMGLIKEGKDVRIISDILGTEDKYGDMDFKVAGTRDGITAVQMDIKTDGLTAAIMEKALAQARDGRLFILDKMQEIIAQPRQSISSYAPRVIRIKINPEKIGLIIGPGGKNIKRIQAENECTVEIEEDGTVLIYSEDGAKGELAKTTIENMVAVPEVGKIYTGKVTGIKEFGAFVEIIPGQDGLVHISELADGFVKDVNDVVKLGDTVTVKVISIDDQGRVKLSRKETMPGYQRPETPAGQAEQRGPRMGSRLRYK